MNGIYDVPEYDEEKDYYSDLDYSEESKDVEYDANRCPKCNSWRLVFYEYSLSVIAQDPSGGYDNTLVFNSFEPELSYTQCYDCGHKVSSMENFK